MRRALPALGVAVLCLLGASSSAAPTRKAIVIHGAASGTHLRLTVKRSHLVVKGRLARARPRGCHFTRRFGVAVCRLREVGAIVVRTGPSGDMVEVLDPLPAPLTAYLGDGSDKLIGNAEVDRCFPQGSRRNRCVGGPGDDVCISGPRNTDCVGGPGNDYCRTDAGSDGCWGGPGRDVCVMGPGQDGCHGDGGADRLYGGPGADRLYGGRGVDYCDGQGAWGRSQGCDAGPRR